MTSRSEIWRSKLFGRFMPGWLEDFADRGRPQDALDDLFRHRVALGPLQAMEPEILLLEWIDLLGDAGDFRERLDTALAAWIHENWGIATLDRFELNLRAHRWSIALTVAAVGKDLQQTVADLLNRFGEAHEFLGLLSQSPSCDPLGAFLAIVARHQKNRDLAPFWWRMCNLPPGVPYFHAVYAIAGLRALPPEPGEPGGGFRPDVGQGLLKLAEAFHRLGQEKILDPAVAEREFLKVGNITLGAYPFPKLWRDALAIELDPASPVVAMLEKLLPGVSETSAIQVIGAGRRSQAAEDADWPTRGQEVAARLSTNFNTAVREAQLLLQEERRFAQQSGTSESLVHSLRSFSGRVRQEDAALALGWAREAWLWAPHDVDSWTTLGEALVACDRRQEAESLYRQAVDRFPGNVFAKFSAFGRRWHAVQLGWHAEKLGWEVREATRPYDPSRSAGVEPLKRETIDHGIRAAMPTRPWMPRGERTFRLQQARSAPFGSSQRGVRAASRPSEPTA